MQRHPDVQEDLAQHAVTSPVVARVSVDLRRLRGVLIDHALHGRVGDHEARTTMRKDHVCNLRFRTDVQRLRGVKRLQPGQQIPPREIRIRLHEDIPLRPWVIGVHLLYHGQELPLIQLPTRVIRLPKRRVLHIRKVLLRQARAPHLPDAGVDVEIGDDLLHPFVHVAQGVVDLHAVDDFFEVRIDGVVGDAAEGGLEVDGDLVFGFCDAGFHDDQDVFHAGEGWADGVVCGFGGCVCQGVLVVVLSICVCVCVRIAVGVVRIGVVSVGIVGRRGPGFGSDGGGIEIGAQGEEMVEHEEGDDGGNPGDAPAVEARSDHGGLERRGEERRGEEVQGVDGEVGGDGVICDSEGGSIRKRPSFDNPSSSSCDRLLCLP